MKSSLLSTRPVFVGLCSISLVAGLTACSSSDVGTSSSSSASSQPKATSAPATANPTQDTQPDSAANIESTAPAVSTTPVDTDNPSKVQTDEPPIVIAKPGLYPEGLTYDPVGQRFIVGSLLNGQLLAVSQQGDTTPVTSPPGASLTGIEADPDRGRLLVAVTGLPNGAAQLSVHDLKSGKQTQLVDFAGLVPDAPLFANGIAVDDAGNIYVTNTAAGVIYRVDNNYDASVFATNDLFAPVQDDRTAKGLNGIVYHDGALLVGHSPSGKIFRVPLDQPDQPSEMTTDVDGMAIDGMYLNDDASRLAVVSNAGTIYEFESNNGWTSATTTGSMSVGDTFPTSVTERAGRFYVLISHLNAVGDPSVTDFEIVPVAVN